MAMAVAAHAPNAVSAPCYWAAGPQLQTSSAAGGLEMERSFKGSSRPRGSFWGQKLQLQTGVKQQGAVRANLKRNRVPVAILEEKEQQASTAGRPALAYEEKLAEQILSGEYTVDVAKNNLCSAIRGVITKAGPPGRSLSLALARLERNWRVERAKRVPEARGNVSKIVGQPFFIPLFTLFRTYGGIFRLTFGPKSFIIVSDPSIARRLLKDNSKAYSKGILAEILEFVMGKGLIPADGEIWKQRRRAIVPSMHRKYVEAMLDLFGQSSSNLCDKISTAASKGEDVEMEDLFSRLTLDVIGKAVFNYEFNSLSVDTGIMEAVYVVLREAEARSTSVIPYWKIPILAAIDPRQQRVAESLKLVNDTLDKLIFKSKEIAREEDIEFYEEYISDRDPSILHFLLAAGDEVTGKQLRDDLMTLLIAGHETSAAVLTWTFYCLALNPTAVAKLQLEVDAVLGDRAPTMEDMKKLGYATNVINESMRLYPQPPVLIRRSLENDVLGKYHIGKGEDIFISTWNMHRSPNLWEEAEEFRPDRWSTYTAAEASQDFRYLPFGGGPRKCIGDIFATYETVTALAMLTRRFNFKLASGAPPVKMTTGATIHTSDGLHMSVTHRTKVPVIPVTEQEATESSVPVPVASEA